MKAKKQRSPGIVTIEEAREQELRRRLRKAAEIVDEIGPLVADLAKVLGRADPRIPEADDLVEDIAELVLDLRDRASG